jgi:cation diffusion facilitator CzcD-associated flavoprotein CzcO
MADTDVTIIGAGPHGLAAATYLRRAGVTTRILGEPMSFWRGMPAGMLLRSNWPASCIAEHDGPLSLDSFCGSHGIELRLPLPLNRFIQYGTWVQQQVASDVDRRTVLHLDGNEGDYKLDLSDGEQLTSRMVVVATGIADFAHRPAYAAGLPPALASHTGEHTDLGQFAGARVLVVGGGQSALESAALLHEGGAHPEVAVRASHLNWLHGGKYHRKLGRARHLVYAPTDVGPMGLSRIVAVPDLFRRFPRRMQDPMAYRAIRPAGALWLQQRLRDVPVRLSRSVTAAVPDGDGVRVAFADRTTDRFDHVLLGTGYRVDIARSPFLAPGLLTRIQRTSGYPVLRPGLESSAPGLFFVGAPAAWSFGPIMRFVAGGWYGGQSVTRAVTSRGPARPAPVRVRSSA